MRYLRARQMAIELTLIVFVEGASVVAAIVVAV